MAGSIVPGRKLSTLKRISAITNAKTTEHARASRRNVHNLALWFCLLRPFTAKGEVRAKEIAKCGFVDFGVKKKALTTQAQRTQKLRREFQL